MWVPRTRSRRKRAASRITLTREMLQRDGRPVGLGGGTGFERPISSSSPAVSAVRLDYKVCRKATRSRLFWSDKARAKRTS